VSGTSVIVEVPVCKVVANPWQVRQLDADLVGELTTAMRENGFRGVLVGRAVSFDEALGADGLTVISEETHLENICMDLDDGSALIQLAWGHHRLEAASAAGIEEVPVELVGGLTDEQMASWALMENVRRKDVTAIEEAQAIQRLVKEFGWTQARVAEMLGYKDAATVSNKLRLLRLPEEIQAKVSGGDLSERAARSLVTVAELSPKRAKELANSERPATEYDIENAKRDASEPLTGGWEKAPWPMEWVPAVLDVEGDGSAISCQGCEKHLRIGSGEVRCSEPKCWKKRRKVWQAQVVAAESEKRGIPLVREDEKPHTFDWNDRDLLSDRCQTADDGKPCTLLRLRYGRNEVETCCGEVGGYEHCVKEMQGQKEARKDEKARSIEDTKARLFNAAVVLSTAFMNLNLEVCRALAEAIYEPTWWDVPEAAKVDPCTHLAWKLLARAVDLPSPYREDEEEVLGVWDRIKAKMGEFGLDWSG